MATRSRWMNLFLTLVAGVAIGFGLGFLASMRKTPNAVGYRVHDYIGEARHVKFASGGPFDVYYPEAYVGSPELQILTEDMNHGFDYELVEQRPDGFKIKIGSSMRRADKPDGVPWLKYRVKGVVAGAGEGERGHP